MSKSINTFGVLIFLGLSINSFGFISAENLVHQSDDWWKEFVHDGPSAPSTIHNVEANQQDEQLQEEQSLDTAFPMEIGSDVVVGPLPEENLGWFSPKKKLIVGMGLAFFGGYGLRMWWSKGRIIPGGSNANLHAQLRTAQLQLQQARNAAARAARNAVPADPVEVPVINDQIRQIVHIEMKLGKDANADLQAALGRSDLAEVQRLVNPIDRGGEGRLGQLVQNYNEAAPILAAIHANYNCVACLEAITDASQFAVGSPQCLHFICQTCLLQWRRSGRSQRNTCPTCRAQ